MRKEKSQHAPHRCPECGEAAFVGLNNVECSNYRCRHFHEDTWVAHVMALPDPGDPPEVGQELDIEEDEPTVPDGGWLKLPSLSDLYANKGQGS